MCDYQPPNAESQEVNLYKCHHDKWLDGDLCIFHSTDPKKDASEFRNKLFGVIRKSTIMQDYEGFYFPESLSNSELTNMLNIGNANGNEKVDSKIIFQHATFCKKLDFANRLSINTFITFYGATFINDADFSNCHFDKRVHFEECNFLGTVNFNNTRFSIDSIFFNNVTFNGIKYRIDKTKCNTKTFFLNCKFQPSEIKDYNYNFTGLIGDATEFIACEMSQIQLLNVNVGGIQLQSCSWSPLPQEEEVIVSIDRYFNQKTLERLKYWQGSLLSNLFAPFIYCLCFIYNLLHFPALNYDKVSDHDLICKQFIDRNTSTYNKNQLQNDLHSLVVLYQGLKQFYESEKNHNQAGQFHYREMEIRKLKLWHKHGFSRWFMPEWWYLLAYGLFGDYGENHTRFFVYMCASVFGTAWILTILPNLNNAVSTYGHKLGDLAQALIPKSLVNLGGSSTKEIFTSLEKGIVVIEATFFYTMLVLFIMAVRRQFKR